MNHHLNSLSHVSPGVSLRSASPGRRLSDSAIDDSDLGWPVFRVKGSWLVFEQSCDAGQPSPLGDLASPALWKTVRRRDSWVRVFEVPRWVLSPSEESDEWSEIESRCDLKTFARWAREAAEGRVLHDWRAPAAEMVRSWLPEQALTVHRRGLLRQGHMLASPDRWALSIPVVPHVPPDLPEPRRQPLDDLLIDAQSRWAMVRFGHHPLANSSSIQAEVDLSGAPHDESLLLAAANALQHAVAWLVEPAELLADVRVEIRTLALCHSTKQPKGEHDEAES